MAFENVQLPDPTDCYWFVAGDTNNVWSSQRAALFPISDPTYQAWSATGKLTARIGTWSELYDVLTQHAPSSAPAVAAAHQVDLLPNQIAASLFSAGCHIVSTGTPALNGTYSIDPVSQQQMGGVATSIAAGFGFPASLTIIPWPDINGVPHGFNQTNFLNLAYAIQSYIYNVYQTEGALLAGLPATWPAQPVTIA